MNTKEIEVLRDYFEFNFVENPEDNEDGLIEVNIKPKGQEFLDAKKAKDPSFEEDKYLQKLIIDALSSYIDKAEKSQAGEVDGEIDEDNKG